MSEIRSKAFRTIIIALILTCFFITVLQLLLQSISKTFSVNIIEAVVMTFFFIIIVGIYEFNKSISEEEEKKCKLKKIEI